MLPFLLEVVTDVWPVKLCSYFFHKRKYFFEAVERLDNARLKPYNYSKRNLWVRTGAISGTMLDISKVEAGWAGFLVNREQS